MSVLLAFEDEWTRRALEFLIAGEFQLACESVGSADEALQLLAATPDGYDFVCSAYQPLGEKIVKYAVKQQWRLHFFIEVAKVPTDPLIYQYKEWLHFLAPHSWADALYGSVWNVFKGVIHDTRPEAERFSPIHPSLLLAAQPLPCAVYRLGETGGQEKIFSPGDRISIEDLPESEQIWAVRKANTTPLLKALYPQLSKMPLLIKASPQNARERELELARRKLHAVEERKRVLDLLKSQGHASLPADPQQWEALIWQKAGSGADDQKAEVIKKKAQEIISRQAQTAEAQRQAQALKQRQEEERARRDAAIQARRDEYRREIEVGLGDTAESFMYLNSRLGFPAQAQDFATGTLKKVLTSMEGKPELIKVFKALNRGAQDYITRHSLMLAVLGPALASQLKGVPDTLGIKLCWAGLLHDIVFSNPKLAQIQTLKELEAKRADFTDAEVKLFKEHPQIVQELAMKIPGIPPDVDLMVGQHHENPDGTGFPRNLGVARLSPQAIVFIVCHDLADFLSGLNPSEMESGLDLSKFMEKNAGKYQQPAFRRVLSAVPRIQNA